MIWYKNILIMLSQSDYPLEQYTLISYRRHVLESTVTIHQKNFSNVIGSGGGLVNYAKCLTKSYNTGSKENFNTSIYYCLSYQQQNVHNRTMEWTMSMVTTSHIILGFYTWLVQRRLST